VFGGEETVNTVARQGLKADMPEVHAILSKSS
jgi:glycine betaine/proline transport system substrate-binding protein